ncbi:S8 family serine peptidase [Actinoplanes sp. NBC_00393]|uniref:S8 family serine peptidase n=1 Tax=Actinoplanes sp. NBC_00393 TaxID=2975953 RepID=UPI002E1F21BF
MLPIPLTANDAPADKVRSAQWFLAYLDAGKAHSISTGAGVIVGLPDSGVAPHPDLEDNLLRGIDVVAGGHGIGQFDQIGHGTQMAGLIVAHGRDGVGALGIAPAAKVLPIKIFGSTDTDVNLHAGIKWAARNGVEVISISSTAAPSKNLDAAVDAAATSDSVIVASAGNRSRDAFMRYPAVSPGVLAVGAIDRNGRHADYSLTGPSVGICAPGTEIVTTGLDNGYRDTDGTSAATAIVSGAAALVRSRFPELSAQEVIHRLTATATDIGPPGRDDECGFGVLNIVKALTAYVPPVDSTTGPGADPSGAAVPSGSASSAHPPGAETGGSALLAVTGGGAAIVAIGTLLAFAAARRRRRPG